MHQPVATSKGKRRERERERQKRKILRAPTRRGRGKRSVARWINERRVARAFAIINISPFITSTDYMRQNVTDYHFPDRSIYDFSNFPGRSFVAHNSTVKNVL